jgi:quinol monooxygenase YgiN
VSALEKHLRSEHTTALLAELRELAAGKPEVHVLVPAAE